MSKATWYFGDGKQTTKGATGNLFVLIEAGWKVARRQGQALVGWHFEWRRP